MVYLLYTGQHYDPLVGPAPEFARQFQPATRDAAGARAREAAACQIALEHTQEAAQKAIERSLPAGSLPSTPVGPNSLKW